MLERLHRGKGWATHTWGLEEACIGILRGSILDYFGLFLFLFFSKIKFCFFFNCFSCHCDRILLVQDLFFFLCFQLWILHESFTCFKLWFQILNCIIYALIPFFIYDPLTWMAKPQMDIFFFVWMILMAWTFWVWH